MSASDHAPPNAAALATPALGPAERAAFAAELTALNLRHVWWLGLISLATLVGTIVFDFFYPLPMHVTVQWFNGTLAALCLVNLGITRRLQRGDLPLVWSQLFVMLCAAETLGAMNAYFFAALPGYGLTSIYVVGVMFTAVLFRLAPRVLFPLLALNHAALIAVLLRQEYGIRVLAPAATDYTAVALVSGLAGWLLHRAHWQNFCKERVIAQRTAALHEQNRELARLHRLELDEKIAARLAEEKARLEVLRYQLNPHFLFNALTSICAQLPPALAGARATIERLTDFCEATLFRPADDRHPTLAQEMKLLRAYLDIEQARWGELLVVEIAIAPDAADEPMPSLLMLPLVENALKYGRATQRGAMKISIAAQCDDGGALVVEIANTGEWVAALRDPSVPSLGIGLENLRQRLHRYYPGAHSFTTEARDGWVRVVLRLAALKPKPAVESVT